ncbi:hypothetical protein, partial [Enterobacter hormaechei]
HFVLHDKNTFCIFNPSKRNIDSLAKLASGEVEIRSVERRDSKPCVGRPAGSWRAAMVRNWNVL